MADRTILFSAPMRVLPRLTHYSAKPLGPIWPAYQTGGPFGKPRGLWVSDDAAYDGDACGWADWCRAEGFRLDHLAFRSTIEIAAAERVLWLRSVEDIDSFDRQFGQEVRSSYDTIRWDRVAAEWGGILITPYQWERRLSDKARWYYCWDCASGCIWDDTLIASVEPDAAYTFSVEHRNIDAEVRHDL